MSANPHWLPSAQELRKIESAARNTNSTATQIAGWLGAPVSSVSQIVEDVRAGK